MASTQRQGSLGPCLVVFALLSGCTLAATSPRYLSVGLDELISSKARVSCYDPDTHTVRPSGNKLAIHPACSSGSDFQQAGLQNDILLHDSARLTTLLQRSALASSNDMVMAPAPDIGRIPWPSVAAPAEAPSVTIPDRTGTSLDTLEFVVVVGFGTPARSSAIMFDTGSDISWIQCQPCSGHCYPQHDPIFDPTKSTTYKAVPCGTPECMAAGGQCNATTCLFSVLYGDGSSTSGVLSQETLSFSSSRTFPSFAFGCSEQNDGGFGEVDGLLGLGRGQLSLPSQAAPSFGGTFSYCLPSFNTTPGYLSIGSTPVSGNKQVQYTAMGNKPAPAYDILDTCYDFTGQSAIFIPAVSFIFSDGAVFDLNFYGIMIFPDPSKPAIGCLAFVSRPTAMSFSIVGNTQQRSTEVIYDVTAQKIGFVPFSC
ncbi:aspartyl protease AED1-like [Triticum aestivum]|uniref:aspartyl protease AED1-like n=1 Tax=Triticum aestivum TaxID=4565 RepID=UPI001D01FF93|nr:aspartyl protease AED1-like [Triticum aestivum]